MDQPTDLTILFNQVSAEAHEELDLPDLPHHALLDARMLAELFKALAFLFALSP
jgi:DNA polymerase III epsilon subunit-like protein